MILFQFILFQEKFHSMFQFLLNPSLFLTEKALDVTRDQTQGSSDEAVAYPYTLAIGTHSKNSIKQVLESMLSKLGL